MDDPSNICEGNYLDDDRNDAEPWTRCPVCSTWFHETCAMFMADIPMTLFVRIVEDNLDGQQLNISHYDGRIRVIFFIRFYGVNKVSGFFGCIVQIN